MKNTFVSIFIGCIAIVTMFFTSNFFTKDRTFSKEHHDDYVYSLTAEDINPQYEGVEEDMDHLEIQIASQPDHIAGPSSTPFILEVGDAQFTGAAYVPVSAIGLNESDVPPMDAGMINVTSTFSAYRITASISSLDSIDVSIPYDKDLLPIGFTEDEIQTYCYDAHMRRWMLIPRDSIELELQLIVSSAKMSLSTGGEGDGSLDFINAVIRTPEMPEASSYTPTSIKELEAANPLEGLPMMHPPVANNSGTANLNYPIDIPAGRQGMQPNISLSYSSGGGNGWLGVGWDIPIPSISVETRWGVPRYNVQKESEVYVLDGEQLVTYDNVIGDFRKMPHRTNEWTNRLPDGTQYYPRKNEVFDSIVRHGTAPNNYWWSVTHRNGVTDFYGKRLDSNSVDYGSVLCDPVTQNIAQWMLTESVDINGNWVRYYYDTVSYAKTPNSTSGIQIYLDSICYTGWKSLNSDSCESGRYKVIFQRKENPREDVSINLNHGFKETSAALLCNLSVRYNNSEIRAYCFYYENSRNSMFKTRMTDVAVVTVSGSLAKCYEEIQPGYNNAIYTHFDYFDAPEKDEIFGTEKHLNLGSSDDNVKSWFITNPIDLGNEGNSTALGATRGKSWNVGGTATVGIGPVVPITSLSVGGNFNYSRSQSEGALTLIDLDGDGLSDKVFKKGNKIYYRKQIADSDTSFHFGDTISIDGLSDFLQETSVTTTWGMQASAGCAYSGSWPQTTSTTSVYFSDVNGDGLPDLITDEGVLFNVTENGIVSFRNYYVTNTGDGVSSSISDTIVVGSLDCPGIIFDGAVNDSIACSLDWEFVERFFIKDYWDNNRIIALADSLINTGEYDCLFHYASYDTTEYGHTFTNGFMDVYHKVVRCTPKSFDPDLETIKVWVAQDDGTVNILSDIELLQESSRSFVQSKRRDGIKYSVQVCKDVQADANYRLLCSSHSILLKDSIGKDDFAPRHQALENIRVSKGDIIMFRLQSGKNREFDNATWKQKISYIGSMDTFNSERDFIVSGDKYFQAHKDDSKFDLDIQYSINHSTIDTAILIILSTDNGIATLDTVRLYANRNVTINKSHNLMNSDYVQIYLQASDYGSFDIRPHIRYVFPDTINSNAVSDTVDYYPPVNMMIGNYSQTKEDTICHWLFGPLYRGWGQFAYNNNDTVGGLTIVDSIIDLSMLIPTVLPHPQDATEAAADTANIRSFVPATDTIHPQESSVISDSYNNSSMFNPLTTNTKWVEMQPDSRHGAWVGYGNINYIIRDTLSNARIPKFSADENTVDIVEYDHPVPVVEEGMGVKTVRKQNTSKLKNQSLSLSIPVVPISIGVSHSDGENTIVTDYMDLNGDRYPDFIGQVNVQYSQPWGGIGPIQTIEQHVQGISSSGTISKGSNFGGSYSLPSRGTSNNPKNSKISFNGSGNVGANLGGGTDNSEFSWMDINGDGLPDKVNAMGSVALNRGYGFLPFEHWGTQVIREGSSLNFGLSMGVNFNVGQASIGGGIGVNLSRNLTDKVLMDFNGDGLPDIIEKTTSGINVRYNKGDGNWSYWEPINGISQISFGRSYSESADLSVTLGMTFFSILKVCVGVSGSPYNRSFSKDSVQITDINGDGYPDYVTSSDESSMTIRYNLSGKTNLLQKVTNFTGSAILLDYEMPLSSFEKPQRCWTLSKVEVLNSDSLCPIGGNRSKTTFEYDSPHYDRSERMDYGFGSVTTYQWNTDGSIDRVYRYTVENYDNRHFSRRGKKTRDCIYDAQGNPFIENLYEVTMIDFSDGDTTDEACPSIRYKGRETDICKYYEGDSIPHVITAVQREYDRRRNVTKYINFGYSWNNPNGVDECFKADIHYKTGMPNNLISLQDSIVIYNHDSSTVLQKRYAAYDNCGHLIHITQCNNAGSNAEFDIKYDKYGNVSDICYPKNAFSQRMQFKYVYDSIVHAFPVEVSNSYGYQSSSSYDFKFGKPTRTIDINGNVMCYQYDDIGRLVKINGPYEQGNNAYTITMEYYPHIANSNTGSKYSYAYTFHFDRQHPSNPIRTTLICDGLGRIMQTKKDAEIGGTEVSLVTGKVEYDCFGRVVKQYHPFTEDIDSAKVYNDTITLYSETVSRYDILDRQTEVIQPLNNYTTRYRYWFGNAANGNTCFQTTVTDPNGNSTRTLMGSRQQQLKITAPLGIETSFEYSPLVQLVRSTDPDNLSTTYQYDMLGRMTQRTHPDAGTDRYSYDPCGNMIKHVNGNSQIVKYKYDYNHLTDIEYPNYPANNVHYEYGGHGAAYNRTGRIMFQEDASGWQIFSYGKLGEVTENIRTFALPFESKPFTFKMKYTYDSFNRIQQMTYPDGEKVNYFYNLGGMLDSIGGSKDTSNYAYVSHIAYNRFELKDSVRYGNGSLTTYRYDKLLRLDSLISYTGDAAANRMQLVKYKYDAVGNIMSIANYADTVSGLGGRYDVIYNYDALYRLTSAQGAWNGVPDTNYAVRMQYLPNGRIIKKVVENTATIRNHNFDRSVGYDREYIYFSGTSKLNKIAETNGLTQYFNWDGNGNLIENTNISEGCIRQYCWDEDNRLQGAIDCHYASYYQYDANGERTYKLTGSNSQQGQNANMHNFSILYNPTLYASPYVVCTPNGYTKHYYAESERIASKIGTGCLADLCSSINLSADFNKDTCDINEYLYDCDVYNDSFMQKVIKNKEHVKRVMECLHSTVEANATEISALYQFTTCSNEVEKECYWYHPDHLGSSSWITFTDGKPVQHLHYLPWGEDFVDQRSTSWSARYAFSAKERDAETGLSYFGARYYSSDLSIWLSVDPMAAKYPSLSPYVYCANNPVKLVDPNGEEYIGTDGERVSVSQSKDGIITVGDNASDDLKRMASMINNSGSKTAAKQFMKLANNECRIHFQIVQDDGNGDKLGYHQPHDENGTPLEWDDNAGVFSDMPAYTNSNSYKEATITIFENKVASSKNQFDYQDKKTLSIDNALVATFAHEAEHNTNKIDILSIKFTMMGGGENMRDVERCANRVHKKVLREIYYAK